MLHTRRYEEEMIRDFLRHLRAEVAVCLFQQTHNGEPPDPLVVAELTHFADKYDTCGLLPTLEAETHGVPRDLIDRLWKSVRAARAREMQNALEAFDALGPVLAEAFACLRQPHHVPRRHIPLAEVMAKLGELGTAAC
jgi:hypothetical protein